MKRHSTRATATTRRGATLVLVVLLLSVFMIAIAFSVDLARVQLLQLELQSVADISARAGAEAMSRGVGDPTDAAVTDAALRAEIQMVAELNRAGGSEVVVPANEITFGFSSTNGAGVQFNPTASGGGYDVSSNAVNVGPRLVNFPVLFGAFVGTESLSVSKNASAIVQDRDIVLVLDRSASMLDHDAGTTTTSAYNSNLFSLEDDMYGPGDSFYAAAAAGDLRHTEFEVTGSQINLSKMQALKQAVLRFRNEIDASRGHESLGLVSIAEDADHPSEATTIANPISITAGLPTSIRSAIVGTGVTDPDAEKYASALESPATGYKNFDYNYLAMRWRSGTNIADGITVGTQVLFGPGHRPTAKPVMVLMTDGRHISGSVDPEEALATALAAHPEMVLFAVSFGDNADTDLMTRLANAGGGQWYHANDFSALNSAFEEIARIAGVTLIE